MAKRWAFIPNVGHETSAVIGWNSVAYIPAHVPTSTLQAKGSFHGSGWDRHATSYPISKHLEFIICNFGGLFAPEYNYVCYLLWDAMTVSGSRGPEGPRPMTRGSPVWLGVPHLVPDFSPHVNHDVPT